MALSISGSGLGLPSPSALYPSEIGALLAPYDYASNVIGLAPGNQVPIPNGSWYLGLGKVCVLQFLDPVTGVWRIHPWTAAARVGVIQVSSDGFNYRVANLTGCPVSAVVTNAGTAYPANTTVTSSAGGSTWLPIIGGGVSISSITAAGAGYSVAPLVFIPAPPSPGIQASADAAITSGTVSSITMRNYGGGYQTAPTITILPNPTDPNLLAGSAITQATAISTLQGSGSIMGILCTNPGTPQSSAPTLTISGTGGSAGAATVLLMQTITAGSVISGGSSYTYAAWFGFGAGPGATANTVFPNPQIDLSTFIPRLAQGTFGGISGGSIASIGTVFDGGLFVGAAARMGAIGDGTGASITTTMGSVVDTVYLQPAGGH